MKMTSRERVLLALQHKEADMVPIDFGSTRSTGINALAYYQLKKYLGFDGNVRIFDVKQLLAEPDENIQKLYQSDCAMLPRLAPSGGLRIDKWKPKAMMDGNTYEVPDNFNPIELEDGSLGILDNKSRAILKRPSKGLYFDDSYFPLEGITSKSELDKLSLQDISEEELDFIEKRAKELHFDTEYAIVASTGVSIFERGIKDFGYEEFLINIMTEEKLITAYLERLTEAYIAMLDKYLYRVGPYINVLQANDDLGMQNSTILPPETYRKIFKSFHREIFQHIKKRAPHVYILLHSCGSIHELLPDLIEIGVDAINPVQITAAHMKPEVLKKDFGKEITFWGGGCSTQTTLSFGTLQDIREEVKSLMAIFSPGGGFIFNQIHNIQAGISPDKIDTMYKTAIENRSYGK